MAYSQKVTRSLERAGVSEGDRVRLKFAAPKGGAEVFEGILLPRIDAGDADCVVLKLDSGYNVGVKFGPQSSIERLAEGAELEQTLKRQFEKRTDLPSISLVSTGGTISARVDYKFGGVKPSLSAEEIFFSTPELEGTVNFKEISSPFRLFSENMSPREWQVIAAEVARQLNAPDVEGVIVTHGTDTLHYTSAALSFMLAGLNKPVAVVGAQRSPDRGSFDGPMNLVCAAHYAKSSVAEVAIVMHATSNDDYCHAVRGTKARKMHASRRDSFRPINDIPLARIWPDGKLEKLQECRERNSEPVKAQAGFEEKTALLKAYPGSPPELVDYLVEKKYRGIVVEATALGHVPMQTLERKFSWTPSIKRAIDAGMTVAFATQCLYGPTSPFVYETARLMHSLGVVYCGDMLPETAYVKLGWVLAKEKKPEKIRELMLSNVAGEFNPRLDEKDFLV